MKNDKIKKLPLSLILIFIILVASSITISLFYFRSYEQNHRVEVDKQLIAITELKVNEIVLWRNERINDAKLFHKNKRIQSIVEQLLSDTNDLQAINYIERMFDYVKLNNEYYKILLIDSLGNQILTYPKTEGSETSTHKNDIYKVKYSGDIYFKDMYKDFSNDSIHLEIVVPIMNNNNRLIAAIELCINPNKYLFPLIKFWPTDSKSAETILVRRDGDSVLFINNLKFKKNSALNFRISLKNNNVPAVMAVRGNEGIIEGIDYRGVPVVACIQPIKGTPWFLVSRIDTDEVYAPMYERRWEIILFVLLIVAGFGSILFFLWRRQQYNQQKQNYQSIMALLESEKRYKTIFEGAGEGIMYHLPNGKIIECNESFAKIHGYTQKEMIGMTLQEINVPESANLIKQLIEEVLINKKHSFEVLHKHKNGKIINIEATSTLFNIKGEKIIVSFQKEITDRKIAENKIKKLNRIYALISIINKTIVRVKSINELYNSVCKIAVDVGEFKMAWIGEVNRNTDKVEVKYFAGNIGNYLELIDIDLYDEIRSKGPTARAVKTGFYAFSNNIQEDLAMLPWINEAIKLGYKSIIALPIIVFEKTIGTFNLYAIETDFFDQQEINLLIEVSNDISFAVEFLEKEKLHKYTQLNLIKSEEKYRLLAENSSDLVWSLDLQTFNFNYISPSVTKILGYTQDEAIKMTIEQFFTPESYKFIINELNEVIELDKLKKMPINEVRVYEAKEVCKNGEIIDVEIKAKFLRNKNGVPYGIQGITSDITKRKKTEEELQKSQQLFKTLTTVTQVGIFQTQPDGSTTYVNPKWEELSGITLLEAQGNGWLNAVHPDDREKLQNHWTLDNNSCNNSIAEYRFLRKDNSIVWVLGNAIPYFKDNNLLGYIGAITDITQQKQIEVDISKLNQTLEQRVIERTEQIQAVNNELEAFSYSVSHDLRAPLRLIQGFSKALNQKYENTLDNDGKHLLDVIIKNTQNMEVLITSLLYISRTTYTDLRKINVDMNIIMDVVINETLIPDIKNQYKITINKLPHSLADAELIKQVWINLISNAIKYTRPKKERIIEIGGWEEKNNNVYYIKDNGVGFNSEYKNKLFVVFKRLHKSEDFEGNGVGLAIVSRIITKHGGKVWAESKLNEGATFWFSLPK